jgi:hypothetical protein
VTLTLVEAAVHLTAAGGVAAVHGLLLAGAVEDVGALRRGGGQEGAEGKSRKATGSKSAGCKDAWWQIHCAAAEAGCL